MKREIVSWLLLFMGAFYLAQGNEEALLAVTRGNNVFSTELYDVIRKDVKGNLVVSPLSVATAVAMLQAGARGETAKDIRSAFHFPPNDQLNPGYQSLIEQLHTDWNTTFEMVNRLYSAEGYQLQQQFSATLKDYFGAEPQLLNFAKNVDAAGEINSFVSQSTHGKIRDLIDAQDLDARTKVVLINAIYFKGSWVHQFPKEDTTKMEFYPSDTASVKVDMMQLQTVLLYGKIPELDATAVSLPYEGGRWNMIILLPNNRTGLSEMEHKLKSVPLDKILESLRIREVHLNLPKFKLESTIDLKKPLTDLGAGIIFTRPDLTGIPVKAPFDLFVSKAVQKAFIEVNEEGSEAAAATSIIVPQRNGPPPPLFFNVDHPFYSMIVHGEVDGGNYGQVTPVFLQRVVSIEEGK